MPDIHGTREELVAMIGTQHEEIKRLRDQLDLLRQAIASIGNITDAAKRADAKVDAISAQIRALQQ